jgi:hypothetical protein
VVFAGVSGAWMSATIFLDDGLKKSAATALVYR